MPQELSRNLVPHLDQWMTVVWESSGKSSLKVTQWGWRASQSALTTAGFPPVREKIWESGNFILIWKSGNFFSKWRGLTHFRNVNMKENNTIQYMWWIYHICWQHWYICASHLFNVIRTAYHFASTYTSNFVAAHQSNVIFGVIAVFYAQGI